MDGYKLASVQINVLVFFYVVIKRFIQIFRKHEKRTKMDNCILKPFPCEEVTRMKKEIHEEHAKARMVVNSISSILIFAMSMEIIFCTDLISYPFIGVHQKLYFGSISLISVCVFNLVLSLATYRNKTAMLHHLCRYIIGLTVLLTSLYTNEIPLCSAIAMVTVGSVFTDEIKEVLKLNETRGKYFSIFLLAHLIMNYFCQLLLPIMIVVFAMWNTKQNFFTTHTVSMVIFFIASAFMLAYSIWRLRKLTMAYSNEKLRINTRKIVEQYGTDTINTASGFTNLSLVTDSQGRRTSTIPIPSTAESQKLETIKVIKKGEDDFVPSFTF
ncbi:uncharacterized protein [Clytia hemisphaerica]|uniref:Uncharacterized protein n=1 Tax=Clytia hemisphaerica TaxID=252671 RepID=A0A7M5VD90_9CNID|eukprot:TCONS_00018043-protein